MEAAVDCFEIGAKPRREIDRGRGVRTCGSFLPGIGQALLLDGRAHVCKEGVGIHSRSFHRR